MLFPTRMRRRKTTHAFEDALQDIEEHGGPGFLDLFEDVRVQPQAGMQRVQEQALGLQERNAGATLAGGRSLADAYLADKDEVRDREAFDPALAAARCLEALAKCRSVDDVTRLRRRYAAQNHPDRVPLAMKALAERAMADLNPKFDEAIRRLRATSHPANGER